MPILRYFAYGSNMSMRQMAERCPGAQALGRARLDNWRFLITKIGTANITPAKNAVVFGALWRCTPEHIRILDQFEGISAGHYLRRLVRVTCAEGRHHTAFVYWATRHLPGPARTDYLMSAVLPGARALGLPEDYVTTLEETRRSFPIGAGRARYKGRRKRTG